MTDDKNCNCTCHNGPTIDLYTHVQIVNKLNYEINSLTENVNKIETYIYGEGDLSALIGQVDNIHKNYAHICHQVDRIEDKIDELEYDGYSDHDARINNLENIGAEKRLILLENNRQHSFHDRKEIREKINKIEKECVTEDTLNLSMNLNIGEINKRLEELEINLLRTIEYSITPPNNKKPHKCPVCDGISHLHKSDNKEKLRKNFKFYREYESCHACAGKGIVWG